jgi:hypothetical protein
LGETTWAQLEAYDKQVRRAVGGECGRLRIRGTDDAVLYIAEKPFPGSRQVSPAEACSLASAAIDNLSPEKHSFRLLGSWSDAQPSKYRLLGRHEHIDHKKLKAALVEQRAKVQDFAAPKVTGLLWRTDTEEQANLLWNKALEKVCPSLAIEEDSPIGETWTDPSEDWFEIFDFAPPDGGGKVKWS